MTHTNDLGLRFYGPPKNPPPPTSPSPVETSTPNPPKWRTIRERSSICTSSSLPPCSCNDLSGVLRLAFCNRNLATNPQAQRIGLVDGGEDRPTMNREFPASSHFRTPNDTAGDRGSNGIERTLTSHQQLRAPQVQRHQPHHQGQRPRLGPDLRRQD